MPPTGSVFAFQQGHSSSLVDLYCTIRTAWPTRDEEIYTISGRREHLHDVKEEKYKKCNGTTK
ncbi:unnamed protein product [Nesidiocoris tenuis]|nr:unnamed protein product [Nesidiocoris tenuis]